MPKSSVEQNTSLVAKAATFAARMHAGETRNGTGFPFIVHPIGVALTLREYYPGSEDLEAAGYLHDVLEDTDVDSNEMAARFGADITALVVGVTNDGSWKLSDWVGQLDVLRLKAADTLDNVRDVIRGLEKGHDVWSMFRAGERKADTWRKHVDLMMAELPDEPLIHELELAVRKVGGLRRAKAVGADKYRDAALRFHLGSKHALANWVDIEAVDIEDVHEHEHDGPGTIRNHPREGLSYDVDKAARVAGVNDD